MTAKTPSDDPADHGRLDDRVLVLLDTFGGRVAFSGLRRALGAHPESLSRALRRLEREGLVGREDGGYRSLVPRPQAVPSPPADRLPVASVQLPPGGEADEVVRRLTGRWFGALRWVGAFDRDGERILAWARRDGSGSVWLGVRPTALRVFARERGGDDDPEEAEDAAYELLYHAVEAIRGENGGAHGPPRLAAGERPTARFGAN
ncbi:MAG TPA: hypothetical protein VMG36_00595 [Thermoplasmata archaeon]|nr:hypothetical protein [Thermoplasmata archaeon]